MITDMKELTQSQSEALRHFEDFLRSKCKVFMLKGAAGTGKTTLIMEFIKTLDTLGMESVLMAPTGRAAYVLWSKTGRKATTIHKGIYSLKNLTTIGKREEEEYDGRLHAIFGIKKNDLSPDAVYFVDEASMVSDLESENESFSFGSGMLLTDLFEFAGSRKIVFVGDYAQLPPVGMNFSPALDKDYVERTYGREVREVVLGEAMRQQSSGMILANADKIRRSIEEKTFVEFSLAEGVDSRAEDHDLLQPYFQLSKDRPDRHSAIITYSNSQALKYNLSIRRHYFGEDAPRLQPGDILMIARNNYSYDCELFNGNVVLVEACGKDSEVESRVVRVKVGKERTESVTLRFRWTVLKFKTSEKVVSMNVRLLDNFLDDPNATPSRLLAAALVVDFEQRLPSRIKDNLAQIKRMVRHKEIPTTELKEAYEAYLTLLLKDEYYNAIICKYGYAMTCHKAQGGEWDNVFVDMCRFGGTANEDYFRWAYTAITRASKKLWHFRSPDFNYMSGLVVEPIQKSENIKVSTHSDGEDFLDKRFARIESAAKKQGFEVREDRSRNFQHWVTFTKEDCGEEVTFVLWYNKKGYSNKDTLQGAASTELEIVCREILADSYIPESVPFEDSSRPFAMKLVEHLKSQFDETGIKLLDITHEQYQDVFHLKTEGYAKICLYYTDKGNYTYMKPISSLGESDKKLEALRQRFV